MAVCLCTRVQVLTEPELSDPPGVVVTGSCDCPNMKRNKHGSFARS